MSDLEKPAIPKSPETKEFDELKTLLIEAAARIFRDHLEDRPSMNGPESDKLVLRAFDHIKDRVLPGLDTSKLNIRETSSDAGNWIIKKILERVAETVTSAEQFESVYHSHWGLFKDIPQNEYEGIVRWARERVPERNGE